jgi:hypothetical protein
MSLHRSQQPAPLSPHLYHLHLHFHPPHIALQTCIQHACTLREIILSINTTNIICGIPTKDRSHRLIITNTVFGSLALLALGIRLVVSLPQHVFGLDGASAVAAMLFAVCVTVGQIVSGVLGFERDTWAVPSGNMYKTLKVLDIISVEFWGRRANNRTNCVFQPTQLFPNCEFQ